MITKIDSCEFLRRNKTKGTKSHLLFFFCMANISTFHRDRYCSYEIVTNKISIIKHNRARKVAKVKKKEQLNKWN